MKVKTIKHSICVCGFPLLNENIPLGTIYDVDLNLHAVAVFKCGGCQNRRIVDCIWINSRDAGQPGFLPSEVFSAPFENVASKS